MSIHKDNATGKWRVVYRYTDWTGETHQSSKRGFSTKREEIWEKVDSNMSDFYTNVDDVLIEAFKKLNSKSSKSELITNILSFIKLFENGKYSPR